MGSWVDSPTGEVGSHASLVRLVGLSHELGKGAGRERDPPPPPTIPPPPPLHTYPRTGTKTQNRPPRTKSIKNGAHGQACRREPWGAGLPHTIERSSAGLQGCKVGVGGR